jgi:hypothetical protein
MMIPRNRFTAVVGVLSDAKVSSDKDTGQPVLVIETDKAVIELLVPNEVRGPAVAARFAQALGLAAGEFEECCVALEKTAHRRLSDLSVPAEPGVDCADSD